MEQMIIGVIGMSLLMLAWTGIQALHRRATAQDAGGGCRHCPSTQACGAGQTNTDPHCDTNSCEATNRDKQP